MSTRSLSLVLPFLALPLVGQADALPEAIVKLQVLPGWEAADDSRMAGLSFRLAPGWKTYWRAPGAAGIPPLFDWTGSENLGSATIHWPTPDVFMQNDMRSIGYHDQVVLPLTIVPLDPTQPVVLAGRIDIGVCQDICVPAELAVMATIPAGSTARDPAIVAALIDRPMAADEAGLAAAVCNLTPDEDGMVIEARLTLPPLGADEVVVIETADASLWVSEAVSVRQGDDLIARADLRARDGGAIALDRAGLRMTVLADGRAVDVMGCSG
jgi:DsbC/DsbD-like thiol-disulfide interchange protein